MATHSSILALWWLCGYVRTSAGGRKAESWRRWRWGRWTGHSGSWQGEGAAPQWRTHSQLHSFLSFQGKDASLTPVGGCPLASPLQSFLLSPLVCEAWALGSPQSCDLKMCCGSRGGAEKRWKKDVFAIYEPGLNLFMVWMASQHVAIWQGSISFIVEKQHSPLGSPATWGPKGDERRAGLVFLFGKVFLWALISWMASLIQWTCTWANSIVRDREAWCATVHGVVKGWTQWGTEQQQLLYFYLLAVLGLHCCEGFSLVAVSLLLTEVAPLVWSTGSKACRLQ